MSVSSEKPSSESPVEIGPSPYFHRSDCNICRKQDGLKTGSVLLDAPLPSGYVVEGEHFLVEHAPLQSSTAPHFHLWLIPKKDVGELRGAAYIAQEPPLTTTFADAEAISQRIRSEFEAS